MQPTLHSVFNDEHPCLVWLPAKWSPTAGESPLSRRQFTSAGHRREPGAFSSPMPRDDRTSDAPSPPTVPLSRATISRARSPDESHVTGPVRSSSKDAFRRSDAPRRGQESLHGFATVSRAHHFHHVSPSGPSLGSSLAHPERMGELGPKVIRRHLQRNTTRGHYRGILIPGSSKNWRRSLRETAPARIRS